MIAMENNQNNQYGQYNQPPYQNGQPNSNLNFNSAFNSSVLQEKNIAICVVLSFVTFGIYYIVWKYNMCKSMRQLQNDDSGCLGEMLCMLIVPFYMLYWFYTRSQKASAIAQANGVRDVPDNGVLYLVLSLLGWEVVSMALMQNDLNKFAQQPITGHGNYQQQYGAPYTPPYNPPYNAGAQQNGYNYPPQQYYGSAPVQQQPVQPPYQPPVQPTEQPQAQQNNEPEQPAE